MTRSADAGDWVEIQRIVLAVGERAPQVPSDTQQVPLEMRVKGRITRAAHLGEEVEIVTVTGRRVAGTLLATDPGYEQSFGSPPAALRSIGAELRELLRSTSR
jgi:hypothetical protein